MKRLMRMMFMIKLRGLWLIVHWQGIVEHALYMVRQVRERRILWGF